MRLVHTLIGTALVAAGASALNQWWERDTDRLMRRTRLRPLADRRLHPQDGLWFGVLLTAVGIADLTLGVNPLTAGGRRRHARQLRASSTRRSSSERRSRRLSARFPERCLP